MLRPRAPPTSDPVISSQLTMQHQLPAFSFTPPTIPASPSAVQAAPERRRRRRRDQPAKRRSPNETPSRSPPGTDALRIPNKRRVRPAQHPALIAPTAVVQAPVRPPPSVDSLLVDSDKHIHAIGPIPPPTTVTVDVGNTSTRRKQKRRRRPPLENDRVVSTDDERDVADRCAVYSCNIQMKQLARKKDLKGCLRLLGEIRQANLSPDKYTYSTLLSCCARSGALDVAMDLYNCMMTEGVPVDDYIRTNLLTVAANSSPPQLEMCARLFKSTPKPSRFMINVMMDAYARGGRLEECLTTYRYMSLRSMQADRYTVSALVKAYVMTGRLEEAVEKIHEMHAAGLEVPPAAFGQVMDAFGKRGALGKAVDLFDSMTLYGVQPTQITYNILIGACEHVSMTERAFEMYEEMKATSSFSGDRYTFHSLMKCSLRIADGWRAFDLYRRIKRATFPCNQVSYRLALTAAGQMLDLDAVMEVADDIEAHKCKPREDTASFLVAAAIRCSDLEAALKFFGDYVQRQSVEDKVVRFFDAIRSALKSFEECDTRIQGDFQYTSLVVGELERSWRRGL